jgi:hypothetical protein
LIKLRAFVSIFALLASDESDSDIDGDLGRALGSAGLGRDRMLDGSRYFAEFPEENPDRTPLNPIVLCALVAIEREISRFVVKTESEATSSNVRCDSESN